MRTIKAKLRSRRGASITFALLLFLVCAIISGVVIVAASTVGGRMSGLRETDQRYYGATEAARKLQKIFVEETLPTQNGPVVVNYRKEGTTYTAEGCSYAKSASTAVRPVLKAASEAVVTGNTTFVPIGPTNGPTTGYSYTIQPIYENGLMRFNISVSGGTTNNTGTYRLSIVFTPNLKMSEPDSSGNGTATVTWTLNSLSKGRATATVSGG